MTIKLKKVVENTVNLESEIYRSFSQERFDQNDMSAVMWISESKDRCKVWNAAIGKLDEQIAYDRNGNLSLWILVADTTWQRDTPLMRKKTVFSRAFKNVEVECSFSKFIVDDGKIKSFSAFKPSRLTNVVENESSINGYDVYVVAIKGEKDLKKVLEEGWDTSLLLDERLLERIINNDGVLGRLFGKFDDLETGLMAFQKKLIGQSF